MKTLITSLTVVAVTLFATTQVQAQSSTPAPPPTGPRSIQMFQGGSQNLWAAIYPPTTYADGTAIKSGTPVKIKVYRSYDGGKTFSTRVRVLSGGSGYVGQGKAGSRKKPWIDMKLQVPVDNKAPYTVVLGMTAVVGKNESAINVNNLTFRYYPSLQIFGSPGEALGEDSSTKPSGGKGPLHGTWNINGQGNVTLSERGNKVSGSITSQGQKLATLSGTRKGNRYSLAVVVTYEGKTYRGNVSLNVASNGKSVSGTLSADGESYPINFKIDGRKLISS